MGNYFYKNYLYNYAYFLDQPEHMLFRSGYNVSQNTVFEKAYTRASFEKTMQTTEQEKFDYLILLPEELLCNCYFQKEIKNFWDQEIITKILEYRNIKECK